MISLIIPNFNKQEYIQQALESALAQEGVSEIIVIDDASTDRSVSIVELLARSHSRIRLIRLSANHNAAYARNRGLETATSKYVIFFDSDDVLEPFCCAERLAAATKWPDYDMWIFPMLMVRDSLSEVRGTWSPKPANHVRNFLSMRIDWQTMQPLWRHSFLKRLGGFEESLTVFEDPELHLRALLSGARVKCFPDWRPDCIYRTFREPTAAQIPALSHTEISCARRYYELFAERAGEDELPYLTWALNTSLQKHIHWWRTGRLRPTELLEAAQELIAVCRIRKHRAVLQAYLSIQRMLPSHVPGMNKMLKYMLGL